MLRPSTRLKLLAAVALLLAAFHLHRHFQLPDLAILPWLEIHYHEWRTEREAAALQAALDSQTTKLPHVDKVVVYTLGEVDESLASGFPIRPYEQFAPILSEAAMIGTDAQHLAGMWRAMEFGGGGTMCHFPIYGLRFYAQGKLLCETSLCWNCGNCFVKGADRQYRWLGFGDEDQKFLDFLQTIVALPIPTQAYIARQRASNHALAQEYDQAFLELEKAVRLQPNDGRNDEILAKIEQYHGNYARATDLYTMGIDKSPDFDRLYTERAVLRAVAGDYQGAIDDYRATIRGPRYRDEIGAMRGLCFIERGQMNQALEDFIEGYGWSYPRSIVAELRNTAIGCLKLEQPPANRFAIRGLSKLYNQCAEKLEAYLDARVPAWLSPDGRFQLSTQLNLQNKIEVVVKTVGGREVWRSREFIANLDLSVVFWGEHNRVWFYGGFGSVYNWKQSTRNSWVRTAYVTDYIIPTPSELEYETHLIQRTN